MAAVVAILVVALATSTAAYILWHQSLWLRQVENLTARAQADAIGRAAAEWAAAVLAEDDPAIDHLGELWAQPLPPFLAERATLTGAIQDEQAKLNVNELVRETGVSIPHVVAFQRLLATLGLPPTLAESVVDWLDADDQVAGPAGAEDAYYLALDPPYRAPNRRILDIAELAAARGFNAEILRRLAPFVTALPPGTPVNVNTASPQVLQAVVPWLRADDATRIVESRRKRPFRSSDEFLQAAPGPAASTVEAHLDVRSRYFRADAAVGLGRVTTGYRAVLERADRGRPALLALTQVAI